MVDVDPVVVGVAVVVVTRGCGIVTLTSAIDTSPVARGATRPASSVCGDAAGTVGCGAARGVVAGGRATGVDRGRVVAGPATGGTLGAGTTGALADAFGLDVPPSANANKTSATTTNTAFATVATTRLRQRFHVGRSTTVLPLPPGRVS